MKKYNMGAGKHILPGYVNIDRMANPGVDIQMDLFQFPWDFPDNSADEFQLSHIVEHIPHEIKLDFPLMSRDQGARQRYERLKHYDGFYWFFEEVWRIAVNGAKVHVVCPFGLTYGALQDPTHTRIMVPQSFAYLTDEMNVENGDFDYKIPCLYVVKSVKFDKSGEGEFSDDKMFMASVDHLWNTTRNMYVEMEVIK